MYISIAATTHPGHHRDNNEDAFAFCPDLTRPDFHFSSSQQPTLHSQPSTLHSLGSLLLVADGIGGFNAGEVASAIALQSVAKTFTAEAATQAAATPEGATQLLRQAVRQADEAINQHIIDDFHTVGMGTTIVLAWVLPHETHVAWCGDSRCYAYTPQDGLRALTHDHSYVQQLVDNGEITPQEALTHPDNNIITHALGDVDCPPEPEVTTLPTQPDPTRILCTDGLCGYLTDSDIEQTVRTHHHTPKQCSDALLQLALRAGGYDNIAITTAHLTAQRPNLLQRLLHLNE